MNCLVCKKPIPDNSPRKLCREHSDAKHLFKSVDLLKSEDLFGKAPTIFVGEYGYPKVSVGILSPPERKDDAWLYDAPNFWGRNLFDSPSVVSLRSSLINSKFEVSIKQKTNKLLEMAQEISMASKPVDVDILLHKKPVFKLNVNDITMPHGPRVDLKTVRLAENPHIDTKVEKVVSDTDLKSVDAMKYLNSKGFGENELIKLLSVGNLGVKVQRRLVPTKWSITAVHDQLGKNLINNIKDYNSLDYTIFFGSYMDNFFLVMTFPDVWSYELFETYITGKPEKELNYTTDHELYGGRKTYAENCVGGYYSSRLAVLEKLNELHKQASVLVIRFTLPTYDVPLGVWVVLEATRKSVQNKVMSFASREEMIEHAKRLAKNKFGLDISIFLNSSKVLNNIKSQSKLSNFF